MRSTATELQRLERDVADAKQYVRAWSPEEWAQLMQAFQRTMSRIEAARARTA